MDTLHMRHLPLLIIDGTDASLGYNLKSSIQTKKPRNIRFQDVEFGQESEIKSEILFGPIIVASASHIRASKALPIALIVPVPKSKSHFLFQLHVPYVTKPRLTRSP
ncbi:hypothetical protein Mapa_006083 [Marchantia paleacea]|nr:hypothetical protein Mapa_006083 [Marchantia paleacea]